jgi:hypothetical protein
MTDETIGEKAGNKLEEGLRQAAAGAVGLAAKAGLGSGDPDKVRTSRNPGNGRTKEALYADAKRLGIKGRSKMTKAELEKAIGRA